ncbi:glycosyltransferase [Fibrivirga algicola]|uniref:Glycosyltransferase n=1 Tax=Fibrivirga algicola TaxID=2950420 RepID=A0ABX0QQY4_9BACT|nr:glycosyltransferase [Fibrivirga algicola]NID13372.1 glycosyltransferase [Fibrivirga algicola]
MITSLLAGWLGVLTIQVLCLLFLFARTAFRPVSAPVGAPPSAQGVTVVVCANNEHDNLLELLPMLTSQDYPLYEVLVMDDRSTDLSDVLLEELVPLLPNLRYIRIDVEAAHVTPKKYALTIAMKKATYPTVLLTDADCRPTSDQWLTGMMEPLSDESIDIVLGISPYDRKPGFLNFLIRSETLFTAVQYVSLALAGRPYMGVGRNLLYRRELFFRHKGFYSHMRVWGGDDDLFVNEAATARNVAVSLHPDTFMTSAPKETWRAWRRQKQRHLNVGKRYKTGDKLRLGLVTATHVLTWLLGLVVAGYVSWLAVTQQTQALLQPLLLATTGLFLLRFALFWGIIGRISHRLGTMVRWYAIPATDLTLAIYYCLSTLRMALTWRRKQTGW